MSSIAMEVCPMCATCPTLSGRWRLQVRCSCGACGPKMKTVVEAIRRWNSVVSFVRELARTGVVTLDARESARGPAGVRKLMRRVAWQCGFEPQQGL
jgi:hypothetical protein